MTQRRQLEPGPPPTNPPPAPQVMRAAWVFGEGKWGQVSVHLELGPLWAAGARCGGRGGPRKVSWDGRDSSHRCQHVTSWLGSTAWKTAGTT